MLLLKDFKLLFYDEFKNYNNLENQYLYELRQFENISNLLNNCIDYEEVCKFLITGNYDSIIPCIYRIFEVISSIASNSASDERAFSRLDNIKNSIRSTMLDQIMNYLLILNTEKDLTSSCLHFDIISEFYSRKIRDEKLDFSLFDKNI